MSERLDQPNEPEKPKSVTGSDERYPTEQELQRFEAVQEYWGKVDSTSIEEFARDPKNPTEAEIIAVNRLNSLRLDSISFEEYFGYPDPRQSPSNDHDGRRTPEDRL